MAIKYSILLAGQPLNEETILKYLKNGLIVFWFGKKEENDRLKKNHIFKLFLENFFLYVYETTEGVSLQIIDGMDLKHNMKRLELLEAGDRRFNLQQYIIEHDNKNSLIIVQAGAGSGKTFIMINRLSYLLHMNEDLRFKDIAMITFTNKAADSMRSKLLDLFNKKMLVTGLKKYLEWIEQIPQMTVCTIDSFLKRIILEICPLLGYGTNFSLTSMKREKQEILLDILDERFGNSNNNVEDIFGLTLNDIKNISLKFWEKLENQGLSVYDVSKMDWGSTDLHAPEKVQKTLRLIFEKVETRYNILKLERNSLAVSDITHEFRRASFDKRVANYITSRYKWIFCDEFQDSDDVQIETLVVLTKFYHGNLFVVGDTKQSIYRFRGATDSAFRKLEENVVKEFGFNYNQVHYSLSKNYRTSKDILFEIDEVFRRWNDEKLIKYEYLGTNTDVLVPQNDSQGIYKQIPVYSKDETENSFIKLLNKIEYDSQHLDTSSIMVLTRTNKQLQVVRKWCEKAKKLCLIKEKGAFFVTPAVLELCAMMEAFLYCNEPAYLYNFLQTSYCCKNIKIEELEAFNGSKEKLASFLMREIETIFDFEKFKDKFRNKPAIAVINEIILKLNPSALFGLIQKQKLLCLDYQTSDSCRQAVYEALQYEANLQKIVQLLSENYSQTFCTLSDICGFLRLKIETDREEEIADTPYLDRANCVWGYTVHSAKGLEFDHVIIPFMDYPYLDCKKSDIIVDKNQLQVGWSVKIKDQVLKNDIYTKLYNEEIKEIEKDETRLLYVAMTRAKKGLYCFTNRVYHKEKVWSDLLPLEKDDAYYL